jgi:broad specificity phosphatase PhoE
MKTFARLIFVFFFLGCLSCKEEQNVPSDASDTAISTYYFIRHAEKDQADPENIDPELTQKGLGRAMHWAEILNDVPLDAIYSTDFERTTMTAAPASVKKEITVTYYDFDDLDINQFKADNSGKNVLVVGHSNTTPEFVNKMLGVEKYNEMEDSDNGSLFIVQIVGTTATASRLKFNCHCP